MKRVLVTGATGFTGRYLVPLLERAGHEVAGLSRSTADIRDAHAVREALRAASPDLVVHLAGTPSLPDSEREELFNVNAGGTANLLQACAALPRPPERILLASSCYVYGDTGDTPATEDAPLRPLTEYGRSKLEMEVIARSWADRLPIVIVRPFNYTGVGHDERFIVPKLVKCFHERTPDIRFIDHTVMRDFSDVRSVAEIYASLLGRIPSASTVFNVCSGSGVWLAGIVDMLAGITGFRPRVVREKSGLTASAVRTSVGSNARLRAAIDRFPERPLLATIQWMVNAKSGGSTQDPRS